MQHRCRCRRKGEVGGFLCLNERLRFGPGVDLTELLVVNTTSQGEAVLKTVGNWVQETSKRACSACATRMVSDEYGRDLRRGRRNHLLLFRVEEDRRGEERRAKDRWGGSWRGTGYRDSRHAFVRGSSLGTRGSLDPSSGFVEPTVLRGSKRTTCRGRQRGQRLRVHRESTGSPQGVWVGEGETVSRLGTVGSHQPETQRLPTARGILCFLDTRANTAAHRLLY